MNKFLGIEGVSFVIVSGSRIPAISGHSFKVNIDFKLLKSVHVRFFSQEPTLLKQIIEELYAFVDFFEEIKRYEVVNGSSFVQKFDDLINDIKNFIADFQLLVSY